MSKKTKGLIVIIAGPTGVGESTVTQALLKQIPQAVRLVTTTSRPKRLQEKNHLDYHFLTKKQFQAGLKAGKFLEFSHIKNRDHYYGTKREDFDSLLRLGKIIFFNCDKAGLLAVKKNYSNQHISLFIDYPTIATIKQRLLGREPDMPAETLKLRLVNAKQEHSERRCYDQVIINYQGKLKNTVKQANKAIYKAIKKIT